MSPRPRKRANSSLPVNLYTVGSSSYRYKHPVTGKFHGMGSNKAKAIAAAKQLNSILITDNDLVRNVLGQETVSQHIDWMLYNVIPEREYSPATTDLMRIRHRNISLAIGSKAVDEVTVKDIARMLEDKTPRVANQLRQAAVDVFKVAMSRGLCDNNPAEVTLKRKTIKERQRLTLEQYNAIKAISPEWLQNAMEIALITLQRRTDISLLKFSDITDDSLYVIQSKTKKYDTGYLKIVISNRLAGVLKKCRNNLNSPFIIHRNPERKLKRAGMEHWTQIKPEMITRQFKEARDKLSIFSSITEEQRPTFHEIRALGIKLYKDQGFDPQQLAGHASEQMTKNYDSGHEEIRWVKVQASLK